MTKTQLTPLVTSCQTKAAALDMDDDAFYEMMTHPSEEREAWLDGVQSAVMKVTDETVYFEI